MDQNGGHLEGLRPENGVLEVLVHTNMRTPRKEHTFSRLLLAPVPAPPSIKLLAAGAWPLQHEQYDTNTCPQSSQNTKNAQKPTYPIKTGHKWLKTLFHHFFTKRHLKTSKKP